MRILFMGTPDIAAQSLQTMLETLPKTYEICGVFTREDKPVGRKQILTAPPVKQIAQKYGIPVFQPKTLRTPETVEQIRELRPELIVVVAYGRILPQEVLDIPRLGAINLHVSLLPKYRGAAPVQWAVINGDEETGVTIMQLDAGLDTGDILLVEKIGIPENMTSGELFESVSSTGASLLCKAICKIESRELTPIPQDEKCATLAPPLNKEMALFQFAQPARKLHNLIRGLNPWPIAYFMYQGKKIKVRRAKFHSQSGRPGEILGVNPLLVACENGSLELLEVVPEGGKPMSGNAWAAGRRFHVGDCLE
ncbi:methionyl-tRNA formyltransferase [uncultured Ruthenibacterium sp.]|uniref:methionyl-tRNA formyltransferase n=1 Tax=uncultured Ruthenibacterium sp. TaxID=1905347 RepID=UPI00349EE640